MANINMRIERFSLKDYEIQQIEKIYNVAQKVHEESPFDAAHDWNHHLAVNTNGLEIIDKEKIQGEINLPVFIAAAFFHDLERGSTGHDLAISKMEEAGFGDDFVAKMVDLINEHSFGDTQTTLAGKVLWAADKIEYVSKDRFKHSLANLSLAKRIVYKKLWRDRIKSVVEKFPKIGLPSSNQMFLEKFKDLKEYIEQEKPAYKSWYKGLDLGVV